MSAERIAELEAQIAQLNRHLEAAEQRLVRHGKDMGVALAERDGARAEIANICNELGGIVEGRPTATINYLQRIRELRGIEAEQDELRPALRIQEQMYQSAAAERAEERTRVERLRRALERCVRFLEVPSLPESTYGDAKTSFANEKTETLAAARSALADAPGLPLGPEAA